MADVIEIIIRATDLASATIDKVADKIESRFGRLERSYGGLEKSTRSLEQVHRDFTDSIADASREVEKAENEVSKYARTVDIAGGNTAIWKRRNDEIGGSLSTLKRVVSGTAGDMIDLTKSFDGANERGGALNGTFSKLFAGLALLVTGVEAFISSQLDDGLQRIGENAAGASKGVGVLYGLIAQLVFWSVAGTVILASLSILLEGLAGIAVALGAAIGVLVAALSSLVAVAGVIPLAMLGMLGVFAAIAAVIGPAVGGILEGVKALEEAESQVEKTTAAVAEAEEQLARTRRSARERERDAETSLARLKRDNREEELAAEKRIQDTRERAAEAVAAAERRLNDLRRQNALLQTELEQDLNNARAELAGLESRGASPAEIAAARARVDERELALKLFSTSKAKQAELDAEKDVAKAKKDSKEDLKSAIDALAVLVRNNGEAERDAELRLTRLRRDNREQIADAEKRVQEAATGTAASTMAAFDALDERSQSLARRIKQIKDEFDKLSEPTRNKFLAFMERFLDVVEQRLPGAVSLIDKFTTSLISMGDSWLKLVQDGVFNDNFNTNVDTANEGLKDTNRFLMGIADAINAVLAAGQPFYDWLGDSIARFGEYVSESARVNQANGEIANFFEAAQKVLQTFGQTFADVFFALKNTLEIGFNIGFEPLFGDKGFGGLTKRFREFTESVEGRASIKEFFEDAIPVAKETLGLIGDVFAALAKIGREAIRGGEESTLFKVLRAIRNFFQELPDRVRRFNREWGPTIKNIIGALLEVAKAMISIGEFLKPVVNVIAFLVAAIARAFQSDAFKVLSLVVLAIAGVIAAIFGGSVIVIIAGVIAAIVLLIKGFILLKDVLEKVIEWIGDLIDWFGDLISGADEWAASLAGIFGDLYDEVVEQLDKIWGAITGWWDDVKNFFSSTIPGWASTAVNYIASFFGGILTEVGDQLSGIWDRITGWWDDIKNFFTSTVPGWIPNAAKAFGNFWVAIANAFVGGANSLVGVLEWLAEQLISGLNLILEPVRGLGGIANKLLPGNPVPDIPDISGDVTLPRFGTIPALAEGGIVAAAPGGVYRVAEAGYPEAVLSLDPKHAGRTMGLIQRVMAHLAGTAPLVSGLSRLSPASLNRTLPSFAAGGLVAAAPIGGAQSMFNIEINTSQAELDIGYMMRRIELEVGGTSA